MKTNWRYVTAAFITAGTVIVVSAAFALDSQPEAKWFVCGGALLAQCSVLFLWTPPASVDEQGIQSQRSQLDQERLELETWQAAQAEIFREQSARIEERSRDLLERFAAFQEFAEYPAHPPQTPGHATVLKLSQQDREVNQLLEQEAERVYEQIRNNGYTTDGVVDLDLIRNEILDLVKRVARIYSPESTNPLLETSFEQLARSVSRICLHSLVLLEQLPLDVKGYTINELHGYLRTAVKGYGAYKQAAPWLKQLSRGAYLGRIATVSNPMTLGAWWLATEIGRRGAQKLVENVVDRQAVAVLHDVVTVVGVEVANIYGTGYRQRDAAWIYGAELVELASRFPASRDSLTGALREITALPLRSEYDRVYLYRCVANHRAAQFRISDPALLPRDVREHIAHKLESFYTSHVHGKTEALTKSWQNDVESHLDLKLHFSSDSLSTGTEQHAVAGLRAVHSFLVTVQGVETNVAANAVGACDLMTSVPLEDRNPLIVQLSTDDVARFEPPDLDPSADCTQQFLQSLMTCAVRTGKGDPHIDELLMETACYFRRSRDEAAALLFQCYADELKARAVDGTSLPRVEGAVAASILRHLRADEQVAAVYGGVSLLPTSPADRNRDLSLAVVQQFDHDEQLRIIIVSTDAEDALQWTPDTTASVTRRKGIFIDDCEVSGGNWSGSQSPRDGFVVSGAVGNGYKAFFAPILSMEDYD